MYDGAIGLIVCFKRINKWQKVCKIDRNFIIVLGVLKETPHNLHGPSVAEIEVKKSLARMKEVAAQGQDAPSSIE